MNDALDTAKITWKLPPIKRNSAGGRRTSSDAVCMDPDDGFRDKLCEQIIEKEKN